MGASGGERFTNGAQAILQEAGRHGDLWEVRADLGGDAFRLLGFWDAGQLVILTNGFAKKTRKTPAREIELAEQRKRDYLNRKLR